MFLHSDLKEHFFLDLLSSELLIKNLICSINHNKNVFFFGVFSKKQQTDNRQFFLILKKGSLEKANHVILFKYDYRSSLTTVIIKTSLITWRNALTLYLCWKIRWDKSKHVSSRLLLFLPDWLSITNIYHFFSHSHTHLDTCACPLPAPVLWDSGTDRSPAERSSHDCSLHC